MTIMTTIIPLHPQMNDEVEEVDEAPIAVLPPDARAREDISEPIPPDAEGKRHGEHRRRSRLVYRDQYDQWEAANMDYGSAPIYIALQNWRMQLLIMERYLGIFPGDYE